MTLTKNKKIPEDKLSIIRESSISNIDSVMIFDSNDPQIKHIFSIHFQSLSELRAGHGDKKTLDNWIINAVGGYYYYRYEGTLNGIFCT